MGAPNAVVKVPLRIVLLGACQTHPFQRFLICWLRWSNYLSSDLERRHRLEGSICVMLDCDLPRCVCDTRVRTVHLPVV